MLFLPTMFLLLSTKIYWTSWKILRLSLLLFTPPAPSFPVSSPGGAPLQLRVHSFGVFCGPVGTCVVHNPGKSNHHFLIVRFIVFQKKAPFFFNGGWLPGIIFHLAIIVHLRPRKRTNVPQKRDYFNRKRIWTNDHFVRGYSLVFRG